MKSKSIRYTLMIAIVVVGYWIWQSDAFQREVLPADYWTAKVVKHERRAQRYKEDIAIWALELNKMKRTKDIIIRQSVLDGASVDQARLDYADEVLTYQQILSVSKELYQEEIAALAEAKGKLQGITSEVPKEQTTSKMTKQNIKEMSDEELLRIVNKEK